MSKAAQHQDRGAVRLATCHPEKKAIAKTGPLAGLCAACYHADRRKTKSLEALAQLEAARQLVAQAKGKGEGDAPTQSPLVRPGPPPTTLAEALAFAEADLIQALPEATWALRMALQTDPSAGVGAKVAEALLRQFPIPTADGTRRLFESPTRPLAAAQVPTVVVGVKVVQGPGGDATTIVGKVVATISSGKDGSQ